MPYDFFFSYARRDGGKHLEDFFEKLCEEVSIRRPPKPGDQTAFRDTEDLPLGDKWSAKLIHALSTSRAFVFLGSPSYYTSDNCGKEWEGYHSRMLSAADAAGNPAFNSGMVPVIWLPHSPLPPAVTSIQNTNPDLGPAYAGDGLRVLIQNDERESRRIVIQLAKAICSIAEKSNLTERAQIPPWDQIVSPFGHVKQVVGNLAAPPRPSAGPKVVKFVFVVGDSGELRALRTCLDAYGEDRELDWRPYHPPTESPVTEIAMEVALKAHLNYHCVPLDENLIKTLQEAEENNCIVILVVDCWTLHLTKWRKLMEDLDKVRLFNCEILVPRNLADPETTQHQERLQQLIATTFWRQDESTLWHGITCLEEFQESLEKAIQRRRSKIHANPRYVRPMPRSSFGNVPQL